MSKALPIIFLDVTEAPTKVDFGSPVLRPIAETTTFGVPFSKVTTKESAPFAAVALRPENPSVLVHLHQEAV